MLILPATARLRERLGPSTLGDEQPTTLLGQWYATDLRWRPQVALLVNETTLLPVLMPLAPSATLPSRAADEIATVMAAHGAPDTIIDTEREHTRDWRIGPTANRSVVGIMNEFAALRPRRQLAHRDAPRSAQYVHAAGPRSLQPAVQTTRQSRPGTCSPAAISRVVTREIRRSVWSRSHNRRRLPSLCPHPPCSLAAWWKRPRSFNYDRVSVASSASCTAASRPSRNTTRPRQGPRPNKTRMSNKIDNLLRHVISGVGAKADAIGGSGLVSSPISGRRAFALTIRPTCILLAERKVLRAGSAVAEVGAEVARQLFYDNLTNQDLLISV